MFLARKRKRHGWMIGEDDEIARAFAETVPGAAFLYRIDGSGAASITYLNARCAEVFGLSADSLNGDVDLLWAQIHPDDVAHLAASVEHSAKTLTVWEERFRMTDATGTHKTLLSRGTPTALPCGGVRWLTYLFDITVQTRKEQLFEVITKQLDYVATAIPDSFAMFDPDGRLVVCNAVFRDLYGLGASDACKGRSYRDIVTHAAQAQADASDREAWIADAMAAFESAEGSREQRWDADRFMRMIDRPTEDGGRVVFRIDITGAVAHRTELERVAQTDALTELRNRRGLNAYLAAIRDRVPDDSRLVILHVDLDRFKAINDAFGHDAGDHVLIETARRLRQEIGQEGCVARVGGDEFVVAYTLDRLNAARVAQQAEAVRQSVSAPILFKGRHCQIGASVGVAVWWPASGESLEQAMMDADTALMAGKADGRNQTVRFRSAMRRSNTPISPRRSKRRCKPARSSLCSSPKSPSRKAA